MDLDDGQSDANSQLLIPEAYDGAYLTFVKVHFGRRESERERMPLSSEVLCATLSRWLNCLLQVHSQDFCLLVSTVGLQ